MATPVNVLLCCAPKDERLRDELSKHLKPLARNGLITILHDKGLDPGLDENTQLRGWAEVADIILLLLSKELINILDSDIVAVRALERHRRGQVRLIPVVLYQVNWRDEKQIGGLVPLPRDGQPVAQSRLAERDAAFVLVVEGVKEVVQQILRTRQQELGRWPQLESELRGYQAQAQAQLLQLVSTTRVEPTTTAADRRFTRGRALLIGVGADLPATVHDAEALYDLLTDPQCAGYPQDQVTLLTNQDASGAKIIAALTELADRSAPEDTVFIFFSGHGFRPSAQEPDCYLVPNNYFPDRKPTALLSGTEFTRLILNIKSRQQLLFLDCCFAGALQAKDPLQPAVAPLQSVPIPVELLAKLKSGSGRVVMASSQPDEVSLIGSQHSIFTACLLDALRTASGPDRAVRVLDVLRYLFDAVPKRSGDRQHPYLTNLAGLSENFVISQAQ